METISNEDKAIEIANKEKKYYGNPQYEKRDENWSVHECFKSAIQAMQWKDEQHEKEKQQWIERACRYIKKNVCEHINHNPLYKDYKHEEVIGFQLVVDEQFYIDFKKAMKGE